MAPEELQKLCKAQPFEPFRMVMTDGQTYDVRHPDLLLVSKRSIVMGAGGDPDATIYDTFMLLDPLHIIRVEPLPAKAGGKNGRKKH